mmetsp:Transcript_79159/g.139748  ORF Transcript_79159/g.139748 Transcript_79159/m.139748 type:complete len:601 (+) Transcript_79159:83-1885(+)
MLVQISLLLVLATGGAPPACTADGNHAISKCWTDDVLEVTEEQAQEAEFIQVELLQVAMKTTRSSFDHQRIENSSMSVMAIGSQTDGHSSRKAENSLRMSLSLALSRDGSNAWRNLVVALSVLAELVGPIACAFYFLRSSDESLHKEAGEKSPESNSPQSVAHIIGRIGHMWFVHAVLAFCTAAAEPSYNYVYLNAFAQRYTDLPRTSINCQTDMESLHCSQAAADNMHVKIAMGLAAPLVNLIFGPALGALSDAYGRQPVVVVLRACRFISKAATAAVALYGLPIWVDLCLLPFSMVPTFAVPFTWYVERVNHAPSVVISTGLVEGSCVIVAMLGSVAGSAMSMKTACVTGAVGYFFMLLYAAFLLPESQPPEQRSTLSCRKLIPGLNLSVLGHNSFAQIVTVVAAVSGFQVKGWNVVRNRFEQETLHFSRKDSYVSEIMSNLSQFLWLFFGAAILLRVIGRRGIINVSTVGATFVAMLVMFSKRPMEAIISFALFQGLSSLSVPVINSLISLAAPPGQMGVLQSSLELVSVLSSALGPVSFGAIYEVLNPATPGVGKWPMQLYVVYTALFSVSTLLLMLSLLKQVERSESTNKAELES